MIVVHIESGLGNQMMDYVDYLVYRNRYKHEKIYIENIVYEIKECNEVINQWNGYELGEVFGINPPNVKELFGAIEWKEIINEVRETHFWDNEWKYGPAITRILNNHGLDLVCVAGDLMPHEATKDIKHNLKKIFNVFANSTTLGQSVKRILYRMFEKKFVNKYSGDNLYKKEVNSIYCGHYINMMHRNNGIEVQKEIRKTFTFPRFNEAEIKNYEMMKRLENCNSVCIHARRGDMLSTNGFCYKYGYFKRAVRYIKKNVKNPVFVFFCNSGSVDWCKENQSIFGIDVNKDEVLFVDWNDGKNSFKDIQLMSYCKHNIITTSSFGWWGAWLNENPNKITCTPYIWMDSTNHF